MAKFHPKNYGKNNTPELAQKIGDILLVAGAVGGVIATAPIALPAAVVTAGGYLLTIGALGKVITKFFGKSDPDRKLQD
jgi:hypothetical protein